MDVVKEKTVRKILPYIKSIENGTIRGPISLHLLVTDYCVNKCNMCDHWKTEHKNSLSLDTIKKIWTEMNYHDGESICLTGGDPILHPNFEEILDLHREFDLGIVCTGNFKKDFNYEKLRTLRWIRFSIDSLNPARYTFIRGLDNLYNTIIPNLKKAQKYNKEVGINFTIQHGNVSEVKDIIKFAVENGIYRLMVYPMHGNTDLCIDRFDTFEIIKQLEEMMAMNYWKMIPENNIAFLHETLKAAYDNTIDVKKAAFDYTKYPCIVHKIHMAIGSDGKVFPCEMIADDTDAYGSRSFWEVKQFESKEDLMKVQSSYHSLGNVNDESLIEIWRRGFDKTFCSGKCENCFSRYLPINKAYHDNSGKKIFI